MGKPIPVFPLFYLAPLDYYSLLLKEEKIVIEAFEHFQKQTYRNRCCIYSPNGKQNLSIPIKHKSGTKQVVKEVKIDNSQPWQKIHWKSLEAAYRSSPYFEYYESQLAPFYKESQESLFELNLKLLKLTLELLKVETAIEITSEYLPESFSSIDLRKKISPKKKPPTIKTKEYYQVFNDRHGYIQNLSIIDLLFNEGPNARQILLESN